MKATHEIKGKKKKRKLSCRTNIDSNDGEDRLSTLPDCLLEKILSLVPFKSAVSTSILSHRWSHLWAHHPRIVLIFNPCKTNFSNFAATVDRVLSQLTIPTLCSFALYLNTYGGIDGFEVSCLQSWISQVCARDPQIIRVCAARYHGYCAPFVSLPSCLTQCQSLVELSLSELGQIDPPCDGTSIRLPKLQRLKMTAGKNMFCFLGKLIKSCPSLEHLDLVLYPFDFGYSVEIVAPKLKYLHTFVDCMGDFKVVINAPKLKNIFVECDLAFYEFVTIPTALQTVHIDLEETATYGENVDYDEVLSSLLQGISCVKTLILSKCALEKFHCLLYGDDDDDEEVVMPVFPNLLNLELIKFYVEYWTSPLLEWLLTVVENIKVSPELDDDEICLEFLEYVLCKALVLKRLTFSAAGYIELESGDRLCREFNFCKTLFKLPRSSPSSQISFEGACITTRSEMFKNGSLNCKIKCSN